MRIGAIAMVGIALTACCTKPVQEPIQALGQEFRVGIDTWDSVQQKLGPAKVEGAVPNGQKMLRYPPPAAGSGQCAKDFWFDRCNLLHAVLDECINETTGSSAIN